MGPGRSRSCSRRRRTAPARRPVRRPATTPARRKVADGAPSAADSAGRQPAAPAAQPAVAQVRSARRRRSPCRSVRRPPVRDRRAAAAPAATLSCGCGRGDHGCAQPFGQPLGDQRDGGAAAHRRDRRQARNRNSVALQRFFDSVQQTRQRLLDEALELGAGHPEIGAEAGQFGGHDGRGLGGQPFLGLAALVAQPGQRPDRGGACRVGVVGLGDTGDDVVEQRPGRSGRRRSRGSARSRRWWRSLAPRRPA